MPNLERHRREGLRADILLVLNVGRPTGASERLIKLTLGDRYEDVGTKELRQELDYLEDKGLVEISKRHQETWQVELTSDGVDVVEGTKPTPAGISDLR
jgi:DNA-binding PadR family transcriptional regulator